MRPLIEYIRPTKGYLRSTSVEHHAGSPDALASYIPTPRSLEALDRIITAIFTPGRPRAWTVTGPYGSGKSAFANVLAAMFRPSADTGFKATAQVVGAASKPMAKRIGELRSEINLEVKGAVIAMATAQREPVAATVARALQVGAEQYWKGPGRKPAVIGMVKNLAEMKTPDPGDVLRAYDEIRRRVPIIMILDEFGKNLEYAADDPSTGDLYLLQQIAERLSDPDENPGFLVTFQHLSFTDYAFGLAAAHLQEWNKIQGRFEDISFLEAHDQTAQLVEASLEWTTRNRTLIQAIKAEAAERERRIDELGLTDDLPAAADRIAGTYPLHPMAVGVLPELTARFGQRDRSLFNFLTSDEPFSLPWFLARNVAATDPCPTYGLDLLYDYFVDVASEAPSSGGGAAKWLEIRSRVREARRLTEEEGATLKTIAILNLAGSGGSLRASNGILEFATGLGDDLKAVLDSLEKLGLVTFREFADEYRIWEGTDFDLSQAVAVASDQIATTALVDHLTEASPLAPKVAQRHGHKTGTLRLFEQRYVEDVPLEIDPVSDLADGLVLYCLTPPEAGIPIETTDGRPVVVSVTPDRLRIHEAALAAAALTSLVNESEELKADRVAHREARFRASIAQNALRQRLERAFDPERNDVKWFAAGKPVEVRTSRDLSAHLSKLCDSVYSEAPVIRNEMLNKQKLTSQGAKARRLLLEGLIERPELPALGIEGYGPERALYESIAKANGMHRLEADQGFRVGEPDPASSWSPAWAAVVSWITESPEPMNLGAVTEALMKPPFGLRAGPIPVLLTTLLLARSDDFAIYQDGSFEPILTADLMERLIKIPERFTVRFMDTSGSRRPVIQAIQDALEIPIRSGATWRNATLLSVIRPIVATIRQLPDYTMRTKSILRRTQMVRSTLTDTREPDDLLFRALPEAVGVDPFPAGVKIAGAAAEKYATRLAAAVTELADAYPSLRAQVAAEMFDAFDAEDMKGLREYLHVYGRPLAKQVLDQRLRSFLLVAINPDQDDDDWLDAIAMNLTGDPASTWRDDGIDIFRLRIRDLKGTFSRVRVLYLERLKEEASDGFEAHLLTLTKWDGDELKDIVRIDEIDMEVVHKLADEVLDLTDASPLGSRGRTAGLAVLAALAGRLLAEQHHQESAFPPVESDEPREDRQAK